MGDNAFSEREQKIMAAAWRCCDGGEPKIDYQKLANLIGMSNPKSASNAWAAIKKKLAAKVDDAGTDGSVSPVKAKATPRKRGKKAADEANGDEDAEEATPAAKKVKTPKSTRKTKKSATPADEDDIRGFVKEEQSDEGNDLA